MTDRYIAFVTNGIVSDRAIAGDDYELPEGAFDVSAIDPHPQIGWSYSNGTWTPPAPPPPVVPQSVSRRQFFQQLAVQSMITTAEALAAMAGTIPSELATLIAGLPSGDQFAAQMLVSGATKFDRDNTFTAAIGAAYGLTSSQLDALWTAANLL